MIIVTIMIMMIGYDDDDDDDVGGHSNAHGCGQGCDGDDDILFLR